jgi:hypothetical protein
MEKFQEIVSSTSKDLTELIDSSVDKDVDNSQQLVLSYMMISNASDLTIQIIKMRETGSRSGVNWLQSCLLTRYLFELVGNHSTLRNAENEEKYLYLRKLQIFGDDTYGVALNILPEKTRKKLEKNNAETYLGWGHEDDRIKTNLKKSVKLENEHFQFSDPWGLTMFEKMKYIKTSNPEVFLSRWRMYSQISHASAFTLWPMWIDPVPHFEAIQCLSIIFSTEYEYHGKKIDGNLFCNKIYESLK